ncbi:uncharacterized protein N7483_012112 [Penicillium malachiteum]|uniref:uncharacterized protein n=1 Tax=Penicillium malachiteum TaxID=1324776 RepID=UPI0025473161|nr:uncharacterized protein N7483_012112 [Penicillium malachiteum]KAJ5714931.1 hypothetical protein N7483_012112 [Penicillium malachiteum]
MLGFIQRLFKKPRVELYGLDHAVLNIELPPQTMWMNMGYWESTTHFPDACRALLDRVLSKADLLKDQDKRQSIRLLDVGCGCGDQSLHLISLRRNDFTENKSGRGEASGFQASSDVAPSLRFQQPSSLINTYIGITLEPSQAALAKSRAQDNGAAGNAPADSSVEIFCADAANPSSWSGNLQNSIEKLAATSITTESATWLLALDTIYHFRPSRLPLLQFACHNLNASYMAFDLILADNISWYHSFLLRIICWFLGAPFGNIVTKDEYVRLLVRAGYEPGQIEMEDISQHVFGDLAAFLGRRVQEATPFGLTMGKYRGARKVFDWWARTGIMRGYVVVARKSQ